MYHPLNIINVGNVRFVAVLIVVLVFFSVVISPFSAIAANASSSVPSSTKRIGRLPVARPIRQACPGNLVIFSKVETSLLWHGRIVLCFRIPDHFSRS